MDEIKVNSLNEEVLNEVSGGYDRNPPKFVTSIQPDSVDQAAPVGQGPTPVRLDPIPLFE